LVANYGGGNVAAFPIAADGSLGNGKAVAHSGNEPHAHFIAEDPRSHHVYAADLGTDQVLVYDLSRETGGLTPATPAFGSVPEGAGPRHLAHHPNGKVLFANNEHGSSVTVFDTATMAAQGTVSTLPSDYQGSNATAEMELGRDAHFLYVSNRGHNSIARFAVDENTGALSLAGHTATGGDWPREFEIDPSGQFLLVANKKSGDVRVFHIDLNSGDLEPTGHAVRVSQPTAIVFAKL
jgi:6-phosphogluconolactonase